MSTPLTSTSRSSGPARRPLVLVVLLGQFLAAAAPGATMLCLHGDGHLVVERVAEACCACDVPGVPEAPAVPGDDCQDYVLPHDAALLAAAGRAPACSPPVFVAMPARDLIPSCGDLAPRGPACSTFPPGASIPDLLRSVVLRC